MSETTAPYLQHLLREVPDEDEVRRCLSQNLREAAFLRSLLRVAKKKTDAVRPADGKEASRAS